MNRQQEASSKLIYVLCTIVLFVVMNASKSELPMYKKSNFPNGVLMQSPPIANLLIRIHSTVHPINTSL
jgi:hypothetical protein